MAIDYDNWKLVPRELTKEQYEKAVDEMDRLDKAALTMEEWYRLFVKFAPIPPT